MRQRVSFQRLEANMARLLVAMTGLALVAFSTNGLPSLHPGTRNAESLSSSARASIRRTGELRSARSAQTATAIAKNRVLVAGGMREGGAALRSFEVFEATTNHTVATAEMAEARAGHSAT